MAKTQSELDGLRSLDHDTLVGIHDRYFPELYRYARYRLGDTQAAEDVAAECLTRLLEAVRASRGPRASLRGWLMGTAANLISDLYRRQYRGSVEPLPEGLPADGPDPSAHAEATEEREALRSAMVRLTPEQQHVLALRFGAGCSLAETADIVGKQVNAVKALQFRALSALRRYLGEGEP